MLIIIWVVCGFSQAFKLRVRKTKRPSIWNHNSSLNYSMSIARLSSSLHWEIFRGIYSDMYKVWWLSNWAELSMQKLAAFVTWYFGSWDYKINSFTSTSHWYSVYSVVAATCTVFCLSKTWMIKNIKPFLKMKKHATDIYKFLLQSLWREKQNTLRG
jgi:hypothetical protein